MSGSPAAHDGLPQTAPLTGDGDLAARMVDGIRRYLLHRTDATRARRLRGWNPDVSSRQTWDRWLAPRRRRLAHHVSLTTALFGTQPSAARDDARRHGWRAR